jgi:PilZ domain
MTNMQDIQHDLDVENRRIARRFKLNLPLVCDGRPTTSINISLTGIRYVSPQAVNQGSKADLKVCFGSNQVNLVGEAVWTEPVGIGSVVGASFITGSDVQGLSRYLSELID